MNVLNRFDPLANSYGQKVLLWLLVLSQAATIWITWRLWQIHRSPPMLPVLRLPEIDTAIVLLLSLACILFRPVAGVIIHTLTLVYAVLIDQTRLQPEIFSLTILMWSVLPSHGLKMIGRAHLISLWFFAGINKLLSAGYLSALSFSFHSFVGNSLTLAVPLIEICLAVLAIIPRTRKLAAWLALILHLGILVELVLIRHSNLNKRLPISAHTSTLVSQNLGALPTILDPG